MLECSGTFWNNLETVEAVLTASSSPVADGCSQQSDLSGEHQGDVQGDDEEEEDAEEDERRPQSGSPFAECQNLPPHHQRVRQPPTQHQSHLPIATERSRHPRSPSTHHFQPSPTRPSRRGDEFSCRAQDLLTIIMIKVPLIKFRFRRLHRSAILSGDMASEHGSYFSHCSVFALLSTVLPPFHLCLYSCIIFHLSYLLYLPHVIVNCVPI